MNLFLSSEREENDLRACAKVWERRKAVARAETEERLRGKNTWIMRRSRRVSLSCRNYRFDGRTCECKFRSRGSLNFAGSCEAREIGFRFFFRLEKVEFIDVRANNLLLFFFNLSRSHVTHLNAYDRGEMCLLTW